MTYREETGPGWVLRCGRWQDVLGDVTECAAVVSDPPYGSRSMTGFRSGNDYRADRSDDVHGAERVVAYTYEAWTLRDAKEFVRWSIATARHWCVVFNDDDTAYALRRMYRWAGWYSFGDVPWCKDNPPPRFSADGPSSGAEHITVARPRHVIPPPRRGSRPPWYPGKQQNGGALDSIVTGQKPLALMRKIVRDYTLPGDLVIDPFCGGGTTALACAIEGRRCITSEVNADTFERAVARLRRGFTADLFNGAVP